MREAIDKSFLIPLRPREKEERNVIKYHLLCVHVIGSVDNLTNLSYNEKVQIRWRKFQVLVGRIDYHLFSAVIGMYTLGICGAKA